MDKIIAMIMASFPGATLAPPPPPLLVPHVRHVQRQDKVVAPSRVSVIDTVSGINGI